MLLPLRRPRKALTPAAAPSPRASLPRAHITLHDGSAACPTSSLCGPRPVGPPRSFAAAKPGPAPGRLGYRCPGLRRLQVGSSGTRLQGTWARFGSVCGGPNGGQQALQLTVGNLGVGDSKTVHEVGEWVTRGIFPLPPGTWLRGREPARFKPGSGGGVGSSVQWRGWGGGSWGQEQPHWGAWRAFLLISLGHSSF